MRIMRFVCRLILPAGIVLGGVVAANAQGSEAARQACTPDAMRLCAEFIPNAAKVKSCMLAKRRQLSHACLEAMRGGGRAHGRHYVRRRHYRHYRHYRHVRYVHRRHHRR